jgi:hypothetical protein
MLCGVHQESKEKQKISVSKPFSEPEFTNEIIFIELNYL